MTTQAKPKFEKTVFFNSSFYNTEINKSLKDYVNYDPTNKKLISNVNYIPTNITSLTLTTIGQNDTINNQFNLPTNTFEADPKSILQLVNNSSRNTQWVTPATVITDYTNYDNTNKTLISNVSGTPSTVTDLVISSSLGSSIAQKFILPSNSSTGTLNSVLTLSNITTKATTWTQIPTQITNYVNYSSPNLISNVSGTPTNISNLTVGPLICTTIQNNNNTLNCGNITSGTINSGAINANSNLIETTGSLKSRGITVQNVNNIDVMTVSNTGSLIAKSLQAKGFTIKDPSDLDSATISSSGALVCTTIQTNGNTINGGAITGTSLSAGTGIISTSGAINGGAITGTSLSAGTGSISGHTITASSNLVSTGGIIVNDGTNNTSTVQQDGQITCKNFLIRQPGTSNFPLSISGTGDVLGNGADFVRLQATGLNIFNTLTSGTFGTLQASINNAGALSCNSITSNNNSISAGNGAISTTTLNSSTIGGVLNIGGNQTTGDINIANNASRTGAVNIATLTTGAHAINIGNSASTQTVTINRPLTTNTINTNNNTISAGTGAISTTTLNSSTIGGVLNIGGNQTTGDINIANNASRTGAVNIATLTTGAHAINIGNSASTQTVTINRPLTTNTINTNNNTISAGTGAISTTTLNSSTVGGVLDIGSTQTTGALSIGNNAGRTGAVNIATLTTGTNSINIGNSASTQTININRPIRMPGLLYTTGQEIGYSLYNGVFFSSPTNPVLPSTFMNTPIPTANLVNNANYLINYYLSIVPQVNFNVTSFQYGIYSSSSFVGGLFQKPSMYSGNTTLNSTRFLTSETYTYSGGGFLRYRSDSTYTFTFLMDFLATAPIVSTGIEFIRIS